MGIYLPKVSKMLDDYKIFKGKVAIELDKVKS